MNPFKYLKIHRIINLLNKHLDGYFTITCMSQSETELVVRFECEKILHRYRIIHEVKCVNEWKLLPLVKYHYFEGIGSIRISLLIDINKKIQITYSYKTNHAIYDQGISSMHVA